MRAIVPAAVLACALGLRAPVAAVPAAAEILARAERAELAGKNEEAASDATRVVVEAPGSAAASQASAVLGRVRLREGAYGEAAWWLERAGADGPKDLADLRALAVRSLLRQEGMGGGWGPFQDVAATEMRRPLALVLLPSGARALLDGRTETLVCFGADGRKLPTEVGEVQAVAVRDDGKLLVAAGEQIYVLDPERPEAPTPFGGLGRFAPAAALAVDGTGVVWVADRKGTRIGRLGEGGAEPELVLESKGMRAEALAPLPPGLGIAVLDTRAGALLSVDGAGGVHPMPALPWGERGRPTAVASDAAGQLAVLDGRTGEVVLLDEAGAVRDRVAAPASEREAPLALALGLDGSIEVATSDGRLRRSP